MRLPIKFLLFILFIAMLGFVFTKPTYANAPDVRGKVYLNGTTSPIVTDNPLWVRWTDGRNNVRYTRLNGDTYYFNGWQTYERDPAYIEFHTWIKPNNPEVPERIELDDNVNLSNQGYVRKISTMERVDCGDSVSCFLIGFGCGENPPDAPLDHRITIMLPTTWGGSFSQINFDMNNSITGVQDNTSSGKNRINDIYYTPPPPLTNDASCVSITAPTSVAAGSYFDATVVMNNPSGHTNWSQSSNYRLGSQNTQDNTTWSFNRVDLPSSTINSGNNATFNIRAKAPSTGGTYNFTWKMVQDGSSGGWFGGTCTRSIVVPEPVPNCSNLTGPTALIANVDTGNYTANFSSPAGNLMGEIVVGDTNGNIIYAPGNRSYSGTAGSGTFSWLPTQAGTYHVFCRAWNDSVAECRGHLDYVGGPPVYTCSGPRSFLTVNVSAFSFRPICSVKDANGNNITSAITGQTVRWTASVPSANQNFTYSWSGDATGQGNDLYKSYSNPGPKTATVTVSSAGSTATCTTNITINPAPTPPPPLPSQFYVNSPTAGCDGSSPFINVSWTASTNATSYKVDRYLWNNGWIYQNTTGAISKDTLFYKDTNITPYSSYAYTIIAYNAQGSTATTMSSSTYATSCASFTVSDPIKGCSGASPYIDESWSYTGATVTNYYIVSRYKYNFSGSYWGYDNYSATVYTTNFRDTVANGVLPNNYYKYKVSAFTNFGTYFAESNGYAYTSPCYSQLNVTCAPIAPTGYTYNYIRWDATVTGGSGGNSYDWSGGTGGIYSWYQTSNPGWAQYTAPGTYREQVKVTSSDGQTVGPVACSSTVTISRRSPDPFPVNTPLKYCSGAYAPYHFLSWENRPNAYYYGVEKYYWNGSAWVLQSVIDRSSIYSYYDSNIGRYIYYIYDTSVTPNQKYGYKVKAYNNDVYTLGTDYANWSNAGQAPACLPPVVDIKANSSQGPIIIDYNATTNISYTSQDATSCSASNFTPTVSAPAIPLTYWKFNEGTGSSIGDPTSYVYGYWRGTGAHWTTGKYNTGGLFNGSSDFINLYEPYVLERLLTGSFTISGWIKPNTNLATQTILSRGDTRSASQNKILYVGLSSGKLYMAIRGDNGESRTLSITGNTSLTAGNWYYFTVVRNIGQRGQLFLNGIADSNQVPDNAGNITFSESRAYTLGVSGLEISPSGYFNGALDEIKIYSSVLNTDQIKMDMSVPDPGFMWDRITGLASGSQVSPPLASPAIYTLTCKNSYSSASDSVWVNINTPTDLTVDSVSLSPSIIVTDSTVNFSGIIRNIGGTPTPGLFSARFCIDNPSCLTTTAGRVGSADKSTPALAFGGNFTQNSDDWTTPATAGNHTIYLCADSTGIVPELSRANNCSSRSFTVNNRPAVTPPPTPSPTPTPTPSGSPFIKTQDGDVHSNTGITGSTP